MLLLHLKQANIRKVFMTIYHNRIPTLSSKGDISSRPRYVIIVEWVASVIISVPKAAAPSFVILQLNLYALIVASTLFQVADRGITNIFVGARCICTITLTEYVAKC